MFFGGLEGTQILNLLHAKQAPRLLAYAWWRRGELNPERIIANDPLYRLTTSPASIGGQVWPVELQARFK